MVVMRNHMLGYKAGLYIGDEGAVTPAAMEYVGNVTDLDIDSTYDEVDITSRESGGVKETVPTTKTMTAKFKMNWIPGDTLFATIQEAADARTPIACAVLDQKIDAADTDAPQGPLGDWMVTQFSINQPLNGIITVDITLKISKYVEWYKG